MTDNKSKKAVESIPEETRKQYMDLIKDFMI